MIRPVLIVLFLSGLSGCAAASVAVGTAGAAVSVGGSVVGGAADVVFLAPQPGARP